VVNDDPSSNEYIERSPEGIRAGLGAARRSARFNPVSDSGVSAGTRLASDLGRAGRYLAQGLRLMVGLPDYDAYLNHMEATHPGQPVMRYEEFFRERQDARYGGRRSGGCC
jgi:uncharacterized short protein YbdD (DUF466 family)